MVHNKEIIESGLLSTVDGVGAGLINLSNQEFSDLTESIQPLTDPKALDHFNEMPKNVPRVLPLND